MSDDFARPFSSDPVEMVRSSKQYLFDVNGVEYLDCINGANAHVGHSHPQVVNAAKEQASKLTTTQGFVSSNLTSLVRKLVDTLPEYLNVCYLCNSGDEANDLAIRLARRYTGHQDIVVHEGTCHGVLDNLIHASSFSSSSTKTPDWIHVLPTPKHDTGDGDTVEDEDRMNKRLDKDCFGPAKDCSDPDLAQVRRILDSGHADGRRLAAHICDPYFVLSGVRIPSQYYLKGLYRLVGAYAGMTVCDETRTGLGRTGDEFWAFNKLQINPDIVTVGCALGNGHPLGAVFCRRMISDKLGGYFSTYGGNPVSCAVGTAVLGVIFQEKLSISAKSVGQGHLAIALKEIQAQYPHVIGEVRGQGLLWALDIVARDDPTKPCAITAEQILFGLKEQHVLVGTTGSKGNIILFMPPMCFTVENSERFCQALNTVLKQLDVPSAKSQETSETTKEESSGVGK